MPRITTKPTTTGTPAKTDPTQLKAIWSLAKKAGLSDTGAQARKLIGALEAKAGSFELLPIGESSESGGDPETDWIFAADVDVGSDHGFWVSVNRDTGAAMVNGFN